jgi:predicted  nucleic acid-binding Zn-ribbon protein
MLLLSVIYLFEFETAANYKIQKIDKIMTQSNLKLNSGSVEIRKEGEEHTSSYIASNKALLNIEQNIETLAEKMSNFELKLNYVLLRQPKLTKKKKGFQQQHGMAKNNQQKEDQNNKFSIIIKRINARTSLIALSLMLIIIYMLFSMLSELILESNELEY